jgi:NAD-dependent SIR2 family protein deacetylase
MMTLLSELRCRACDEDLTDQESTRKDTNDDYLDLCNECAGYIDIDWLVEDEKDED